MQGSGNSKLNLLTQEKCREFEHTRSLYLPDDYKHFLMHVLNGGKTVSEQPVVSIPDQGDTVIMSFLGIGAKDPYNLEQCIWALEGERLPEGMIPIADDPGGNFFFLDLSNNTPGNVYFFHHDWESNFPPTIENNPSLVFLANSFTVFLNLIDCLDGVELI